MTINIISYNILADYLNNYEYINIKKKFLENNFRIKLLLKKLTKHIKKNTIFCLQEVGPTQLSILYVFFKDLNYECISYADLAIFYPKKYKVKLVKVNRISSLADKYLIGSKKNLIDNVKKFRHSYIMMTLIKKNKQFTICNTHLIAHPKFYKIKILQSFLLAKRLEGLKKTILCGDFNSMPDSKVYELLSTSKTSFPYYKKLKLKNKLFSVYNTIHTSEINITTHASNIVTNKFTETIDYIWISSDLTPIKTLPILTRENIDKNDFIPDKNQPSDHYLIGCTLK